MHNRIKLILLVITFACTNNLSAQVTIGSNSTPRQGALLDLTQGDITTKGVGMPRVKLTDSKTLTVAPPAQATEHIGLLVYNTNTVEVKDTRLCKGLHVWDGTEWKPLAPYPKHAETPNRPAPISVTDIDGNTYEAQWFGYATNDDEFSCETVAAPPITKGMYWMTRNLLTTRDPQGKVFDPDKGGLRINPGYQSHVATLADVQVPDAASLNNGRIAKYFVGTSNTAAETSESYKSFADKFGLLYSYTQASRACPSGWRLPSQADLDVLAKGFGIDKDGVGYADLSPLLKGKNLYYSSSVPTGTTGLFWNAGNPSATDKGMNIIPTGYMRPNTNGLHGLEFHQHSFIWSNNEVLDDSFPSELERLKAYRFIATTTHDRVEELLISYDHRLPVRCVQDTEDKTNYDPATGMLTDREGNTYYTADFGPAGRWMTQNLRVKSTPKGDPILHKAAVNQQLPYEMRYAYPFGDEAGAIEEYGLLYNQTAVTNRAKVGVNKDEGESRVATPGVVNPDHEKIGVQGICPDGWHVPSDKEFNDLFKEVGENTTGKYTQNGYVPVNKWQDSYRTAVAWRPGSALSIDAFGANFKTSTPLPGFPDFKPGKSKNYKEGGFDTQPTGAIPSSGIAASREFAAYGYHYSSSVGLSTAGPLAWYYHPSASKATPNDAYFRGATSREYLMGVRCKKD